MLIGNIVESAHRVCLRHYNGKNGAEIKEGFGETNERLY